MLAISVIVPVYNSEDTIEACVSSIAAQSLTNIEIILVNDGSTDRSAQICDGLSDKDSRIKIINQLNAGPGPARNVGIEVAVGEYIMFVDADDWIEHDLCEILYHSVKDRNVDVAISGYIREFRYNNKCLRKKKVCVPAQLMSGREAFSKEFNRLLKKGYITSLWGKLYNRELLITKALVITSIKIGEDLLFNLEVFYHSKCVTVVEKAAYHYICSTNQSGRSLTHRFHADYWQIQKLLFNKCNMFIKEVLGVNPQSGVHNGILLRSFFIAMEQLYLNRAKLREQKLFFMYLINTDELKIAQKSDGLLYKEFRIYKAVLETKNFYIIYLFMRLRLLVKKILRG